MACTPAQAVLSSRETRRYTQAVEERQFRIAPSLFEWFAAALGVVGLAWVISVPVQRMLGPHVEISIVNTRALPPGVPTDATIVPVMLLPDGAELRLGDPVSRLEQVLPTRLAEGPPQVSHGEFGDRHTRTYVLSGSKFYVVCERSERDGPMKVSGIYLP
jgi:hypothetical protein